MPPDNSVEKEPCLTFTEAFLAMYYFIDAYWKRGGRMDGSVTLLRHALGPEARSEADGSLQTADPAAWSDWIEAIQAARSRGLPGQV